jgi:hypothetical protein
MGAFMGCYQASGMASSSVEVNIHISQEEVQKAYQGVDSVYAQAIDGRSIRFPVRILWSFIGHDGIHGRFLIQFGDDNKFESVIRIA